MEKLFHHILSTDAPGTLVRICIRVCAVGRIVLYIRSFGRRKDYAGWKFNCRTAFALPESSVRRSAFGGIDAVNAFDYRLIP